VASVLRRLLWTAIAAGLGFIVGHRGGTISDSPPNPAAYASLGKQVPLPHHVPSQPKGAAFRFAMVHDVLHERFPKHGPAYYKERNRQTRAKLAKLAPNDPAGFPLTDDLATGLARLGQPEEAIALMRAKLARQQAMKFTGVDLYTSSANLGTLLVYTRFPKASAGDAEAIEQFREGVGLIRKSVELNPGAHFGREQWQATFAEFLLAAMEKPELLKQFDCIGNRIDLSDKQAAPHKRYWEQFDYGHASNFAFRRGDASASVPAFFAPQAELDQPSLWAEVQPIRKYITKVGAETGWEFLLVPSHRAPVTFDEPTLGIIDMWRQGGGANPHLALALGETMLRVGQRFIAWTAYERAAMMADRFWPDPAVQQFLRDHCRRKQEQIEDSLRDSGPRAMETLSELRPRFSEELAHGEQYQRDYQRYEAEKIAAGAKISDEHFFDAFHKGREAIASPVGAEEWIDLVPQNTASEYAAQRAQGWGMVGAGLAAMVAALLLRWKAGKRSTVAAEPDKAE
jgi:hypothetical protein